MAHFTDDVHVWTDGSVLSNPDGPGGWCALIRLDGEKKILKVSGGEPKTTNNRMELTAIMHGLDKALDMFPDRSIIVFTDSEYSINVITRQTLAWSNRDLVDQIHEIIRYEDHRIQFKHVRGHRGHKYNEMADRHARYAAEAAAVQTE